MKRILVSSLLALLTLASLSGVARADDISFSGFGPNNVFFRVAGGNASGQISPSSTVIYTETQASPIAANVPSGTGPVSDAFSFSLSEPGAGTLVSLSGTIFADNTCLSGNNAATAACSSLFIFVTANDPNNFSGEIIMDVNQTFALPAPLLAGNSLAIPVSASLVGNCGLNTSGSVSSSTVIDAANNNVSPSGGGNLTSGPCSTTNTPLSFSPTSTGLATIAAGSTPVTDVSIDTTVTFFIGSGTITLPTGSCLNTATCDASSLVPPTNTPEPGTLVMMAIGLAGVGLLLKR